MASRIKVLIVEQDLSDLSEQTEYDLTADTIYFNKSGFTAADIGAAIVEATTKSGQARYAIMFTYSSNANSPRDLEVETSMSSLDNPFVVPESSQVVAWSITAKTSSTGTVRIYKNGTTLFDITLSAATKAYTSGLSHVLAAGDELRAEVISGSINRPFVMVHIKPTY